MKSAVNKNRTLSMRRIGHYSWLGINTVVLAVAVFVIGQTAYDFYRGKLQEGEVQDNVTPEDFDRSLGWLDKKKAATE
jgi:hypothetical protein